MEIKSDTVEAVIREALNVVLSGGSRVDCLTETRAVEVEFAPKWKEAIGV